MRRPWIIGESLVTSAVSCQAGCFFRCLYQWSFLVPLIGGRWYIITQFAVYIYIYTTYSPCQLGGVICYLPTTYWGNRSESPLKNQGWEIWPSIKARRQTWKTKKKDLSTYDLWLCLPRFLRIANKTCLHTFPRFNILLRQHHERISPKQNGGTKWNCDLTWCKDKMVHPGRRSFPIGPR